MATAPIPFSIVTDPMDVDLELTRRFGMSVAELHSVASAAYRAFSLATSLHPKGWGGTTAWGEGSAQFRMLATSKGWHCEDPQGQPRVVSKDGKVSITISSGDMNTGNPHADPKTRNDKGEQTANGLHFNSRQQNLFSIGQLTEEQVFKPAQGQALWVLLYYIDVDMREVRIELSQPLEMSEAKKIHKWAPRYILPPMSFAAKYDQSLDDDDTPDIDFNVLPVF